MHLDQGAPRAWLHALRRPSATRCKDAAAYAGS